MSFKWIGSRIFNLNGIDSHFPFLGESQYPHFMYLVYLLVLVWQRVQTDWFLPASAICFSLSSASPAHTPKEEYAITQTASAPEEETLHDQPQHQGERRDDKSELTEGKSLTGRSAAYPWVWKDVLSPALKSSPSSSVLSPVPFTFRGGASVWIVSLSWAWGAGGGEVLGGASGAAGEGDARGQADGVSPAGEPREQKGQI